MTGPEASPRTRGNRWLSREFSELLARLASGAHRSDRPAGAPDFDVLIVGSGYGGAVAAAELARPQAGAAPGPRIGVLERGLEYLPGAFPSRLAELPRKIRGAVGARTLGGEALFDLRMDGDVGVVLGNGLGGGSLINAGVMERPQASIFDARWPAALQGRTALDPFFDDAETLLGAKVGGQRNTIAAHAEHKKNALDKHEALRRFAGGDDKGAPPPGFRDAAITVEMSGRTNGAGVTLKACTLCGDCATGCNHAAKESLDTNLLVQAFRRGAEIYCGATVLRLERDDPRGWRVLAVHTDPRQRLREGGARWISATNVVLAAGALGSTEILLRSQRAADSLTFSPMLGKKFSGNGDMLAFGYDQYEANAFADETKPATDRRVGPTITGVFETRTPGQVPITIEEMAVPGPIRRFAEELVTTADTLHALGTMDTAKHVAGHPGRDAYAVQQKKIARTTIFAAMGDDGAGGTLRLKEHRLDLDGDGQLRVVWPEARKLPLFDDQLRCIEERAKEAGWSGEGRVIANPLWQLLPKSMDFIIGEQRGPLLTVHPLGGCPMADTVAAGVANEFGAVFDAARPGKFHDGLYVLDGALVPTALAINPALTITALALRAVRKWRPAQMADGNEPPAQERQGTEPPAQERPRVRDTAALPRTPAMAQFTERLASGRMTLRDRRGKQHACYAEITLLFKPLDLECLFKPHKDSGAMSDAVLTVEPGNGTTGSVLRLFREADWKKYRHADLSNPATERERNARAATYALSGSLTILKREVTTLAQRLRRAGWAWWRNRGARDIWQAGERWVGDRITGYLPTGPGIGDRAIGALRLASRAGEVRRFDYALNLGKRLSAPTDAIELSDVMRETPIVGCKRITYARPSNPWRQLQEMTLTQFPGWNPGSEKVVFALDQRFLAEQRLPLFRLCSQGDHSDALMDVISLGAYFARMLISIHIWTARKPDTPRPREVRRLPGRLPGLPEPEIHQIEVDRLGGRPVMVRLARYRRDKHSNTLPPIVTLHGYSASGTTFAHPSNPESLAGYFARDHGRDVWVVDLRTSCGMPTAAHPWTFERVAMMDVPAAIDYVCASTGKDKVDVVAHCMGAAMLSMAVLWSREDCEEGLRNRAILTERDDDAVDRFRAERQRLPQRIEHLALSQIGPVMVFSPANAFRAYVTSFLEQVLGPLPYRFRPEPGEGLGAELLDRLLATMPYPDDELLAENPSIPWARRDWVGSRHRMDALYGADFKLANLNSKQLACIDDFFGPLSLDTVSQGIHLARELCVTNREGRNRFVDRASLRARWRFPTLSFHGAENGLADVSTLARMQHVLADDAGLSFKPFALEGCGHQDSLIGKQAKKKTFEEIRQFFGSGAPVGLPARDPYAAPPWLGPMLQMDAEGRLWIGAGAAPGLGRPQYLFLVPVELVDGRWQRLRPRPPLNPRLGVDEPASHIDGDWFWFQVPDTWREDPRVRYLLPLMVYPQSAGMVSAASGLQPWSHDRKLRIFSALRNDIAHGGKHNLDDPDEIALHATFTRAIDTALECLNDADLIPRRRPEITTQSGPTDTLPLGLVCLDAWCVKETGLSVALGSCQYPAGMLDRWPAYAAWERFTTQPNLLILAGDQIYADASAGLFDPTLMEDRYRKPYEAWLRNAQVRELLRRVPVVTLIDDHEIDEGWEPVPSSGSDETAIGQHRRLREVGERAFRVFQRPPATRNPPLWFSFERGCASIFVLDTRLQRAHRAGATIDQAGLIDAAQLAALKGWLVAEERRDRPKLVLSPALLLPRRHDAVPAPLAFGAADRGAAAALRSDSWDGYPASLHDLLAHLCENQVRHVVFLSGDEHLGLVAEIKVCRNQGEPREASFCSLHSPGLYSPFAFANALPSDFPVRDTFEFTAPSAAATGGALTSNHTCTVETRVIPGNGFVQLDFSANAAGGWTLRYRYDLGRGELDPAGTLAI